MNLHRILVATDLTKASEPALCRAIELARKNGAELLITHAYHPPSVAVADSFAAGVYEEWDRTLRLCAEEKLRPIVGDANRQGVKARALLISGPADDAICDAANEKGVDLIVMGTHGRTGVSRFFLGSVASRVISTAPCPVMTVRAAPSATGGTDFNESRQPGVLETRSSRPKEVSMLFEKNISKTAKTNKDFRRVIATGPHSQLVTMSLPPKEDIGSEVHPGTDQMLFIVQGSGKAIVNNESVEVGENDVVVVPAGSRHNLINTGHEDLRLFTVYAPPEHKDGTVHHRKADALAAEHEHALAARP